MQTLSFQTPESVRKSLHLSPTCTDTFQLFDTIGEMIDMSEKVTDFFYRRETSNLSWKGGHTFDQSVTCARRGDISGVAESERLIDRFETFSFETVSRAMIDDVAGAVPNIPAYLAGQPLNMRRRARRGDSAFSPIAIIVDLASSAQIDASIIQKRGAAILALVRILSSRRPVELWAGTSGGFANASHWSLARIDTTPLDLSVAAHVLTHPGFCRNIVYGIQRAIPGMPKGLPWSYANTESRLHMNEVLKPAFSHVTGVMAIPGMAVVDPGLNDPEKWVADKLTSLEVADFSE